MSDNPTAETTPAEGSAPALAATPHDTAPAAESISLEEARKLRSEAKSLRQRLQAFEKAEQERQQSEMTEAQRLKAHLDELTPRYSDLESKYNTLRAQIALRNAGADEEVADLLASKLDAAVLDDQRKLSEAIEQLRRERPRLFKVASLNGGTRGAAPENPTQFMNDLIRSGGRR